MKSNGRSYLTGLRRSFAVLLFVLLAAACVGCSGKTDSGTQEGSASTKAPAADPGDTAAVHGGYNAHDYERLAAFFEQTDAEGVKNGEKYNKNYSADDPASWQEIEWTDTAEGKRVLRADLGGMTGELDLSGCTSLTMLICVGELTGLELSNCTSLTAVECSGNHLTSIGLTGCAALSVLRCDHNELTALDLTGCPSLTLLRCEYNRLASLDVSCCAKLETVDCRKNELSVLDLTGCAALRSLDCGDCGLTELKLNCPELTELRCHENKLTALDLTSCAALSVLVCYDNQIVTLDVTKCVASIRVDCDDAVEVVR